MATVSVAEASGVMAADMAVVAMATPSEEASEEATAAAWEVVSATPLAEAMAAWEVVSATPMAEAMAEAMAEEDTEEVTADTIAADTEDINNSRLNFHPEYT